MRTIEELDRLPIRAKNIPLAVIVTTLAILSLAGFGWLWSFIVAFDLTSSNPEPSDFDFFMVRLFIGLTFLGVATGFYKIYQLFALCLKCDA